MDLLLFFIKRDEIDIYDIPIARIADEYLAYVRVLEEIDLDGVGDFIYMAALLINIKARMLLPSQETHEEGEAVDPRRELVERLLEYVRFKEAADQLSTRRERRDEHFIRGDATRDRDRVEDAHDVVVDASVYELVEALGQVLKEDEDEPVHEVESLEHSVDDQQEYVIKELSRQSQIHFRDLVRGTSRGFIIATFLALLELARQRYITLEVHETVADFVIEESAESPLQPSDPALPDVSPSQGDGAMRQNGE